ncbi:MAG: phosphatase PAP2 family protein [Terracidiphilus sp.]
MAQLLFFCLAPGRIWKATAFLFFVATCLATLSTGEHYVIDLIAGLAFGAFTSSVGLHNFRRAGGFLALTLVWSLSVRFAYATLIAHPMLTRSMAGITLLSVIVALYRHWSAQNAPKTDGGIAA